MSVCLSARLRLSVRRCPFACPVVSVRPLGGVRPSARRLSAPRWALSVRVSACVRVSALSRLSHRSADVPAEPPGAAPHRSAARYRSVGGKGGEMGRGAQCMCMVLGVGTCLEGLVGGGRVCVVVGVGTRLGVAGVGVFVHGAECV